MAIPLPNLDDRTFADLIDELQKLIPRHTDRWTDHNVSDPGIMLLELFAWLTEATLYRINRVPEASRVRLLELLGAAFRPAQPALMRLDVKATLEPGASEGKLDQGTTVWARPGVGYEDVPFETVRRVIFTHEATCRPVVVRQTQKTDIRERFASTDGRLFHLLPLSQQTIALPDAPTPRRPDVVVNEEQWECVETLKAAQSDAHQFVYTPDTNSIAFGDGVHGKCPGVGAEILVSYRIDPSGAQVTDEFTGKGKPNQVYRLRVPLLAPSDLEPQLTVDGKPWTYRPQFLDLGREATEYCVEPWRNAVRFGNGAHGQVPQRGAQIDVSFRVTLGARGTVPPQTQFYIDPLASGELNLRVVRFNELSPGSDPTSLDDARTEVYGILKPLWRAVTVRDFEQLVLDECADVGRAHCAPGYAPAPFSEARERAGHVSVIAVPQPRYTLSAPTTAIGQVVGCAPDGRRLVAWNPQGNASLWDLETGSPVSFRGTPGIKPASCQARFSPDSTRLVTIAKTSRLWDAITGDYLSRLPPLPGRMLRFSPDSRRLAGICENSEAWLWDAEIGSRLALLSKPAAPVSRFQFSPDSQSLAVVHTDSVVRLWDPETGLMTHELSKTSAPAIHAHFSADGRSLLLVNADAKVHLHHTTTGQELLQFVVDHPVDRSLFFSESTRLLASGNNGQVTLWSTRNGRKIANLAGEGPPSELLASPNGRLVAIFARAGQTTTVDVWDVRRGVPVAQLRHTGSVRAVAFDETGHRIGTLSREDEAHQTLHFWDVRLQQDPHVSFHPQPALVRWVADANGRWLALANKNLVDVWDISAGQQVASLYVDVDSIAAGSWSLAIPDPENGDTRVIAVDSNANIPGDPVPARGSLLFAWSDKTASDQRTIQVWNTAYCDEGQRLLDARRLIASQTHCVGPRYTDVAVSAKVVAAKTDASLPARVRAALLQFFHPLHGGPDQTGWPLGRPVYPSEVFQMIEAVPGIDHVECLTLNDSDSGIGVDPDAAIPVSPYHLVNCVLLPDAVTV